MPTRDEAPVGAPCWVDLMTSDTERARVFYGELFGWTADAAAPEFGGYFSFRKDGRLVAGCMNHDGSAGVPDVWSVYLATADAPATTDTAVANGGLVIVAPMAVGDLGTMAVVSDTGQAAIGMWQPAAHRGFEVWDEPGTPGWFELHTRDYASSVDFYRNVFGWDAKTMSDTPDFRYTTLGEGESRLAGIADASKYLPDGVPAQWTVYFRVQDTDTAVALVIELGGRVVVPAEDTPYGRVAALTDPTGTAFKLVAS